MPVATTDVEVLKSDLDEHGFCLVKKALDTQQLEGVRQRLVEQAAAERGARD